MLLSERAPGGSVEDLAVALFDAHGRLDGIDRTFRPALGLRPEEAATGCPLDGILAEIGGRLRPVRDGAALRAGLEGGPVTVEGPAGPVSLRLLGLDGGRRLLTVTPTRDAETARQATDEVALLRSIIDLIPATISVKDRHRRYRFVNAAWAANVGLSGTEVIGRRYEELPLPQVAPASFGSLTGFIASSDQRVLDDGVSLIDREEAYDDVAGDRRTLSSSKVPLRASDGTVAGVISTTFDISERKRVEADLARARRAAEVANAAKSRFLAQMSHELRTPLNAVIGFAQILAGQLFGPVGDARYAEYARDIEQSAGFLLSLIDAILDATRIEAGHRPLVEDVVEIDPLLADCLGMIQGSADRAGVDVRAERPSAVRAVRGDATALRQIVLNLLSNAVKFTPPGGHASLSCAATPDGAVAIAVRDSGIGVPTEALPRIFEPFEQADQDFRRGAGGAGLGLWISRRLAELHGGTLDIASAVGDGTVAILTLPPERRVDDGAPVTPPRARRPRARKGRGSGS